MANKGLLNTPPGMPQEVVPEGVLPEGTMPEGLPGMPVDIPGEEVIPEEAVMGAPGPELPQEFAPDSVNAETARRMVASAKEKLYGPMFDKYANMLQQSQDFVEDAAMVVLDSLAQDLAAINMSGRLPPYDYLMDVAASVTEEVYELSESAGIYPQQNKQYSEEQELQDKSTTLTIVAGELGKEMGQRGALPADRVEAFMDSVFNGEYDDMQPDSEEGSNLSNIGAGSVMGNPLAGPPSGPPTVPGMEPPPPEDEIPPEELPEEEIV